MARLLALTWLTASACSLVFAPDATDMDADDVSGDGSPTRDASNADARRDAAAIDAMSPPGCAQVTLTLVISEGGTVSAREQVSGTLVGSCGPGPMMMNEVCDFCVTQDVAIDLDPTPLLGYDFVSFNLACGNSQTCTAAMTGDFTAGAQFQVQ